MDPANGVWTCVTRPRVTGRPATRTPATISRGTIVGREMNDSGGELQRHPAEEADAVPVDGGLQPRACGTCGSWRASWCAILGVSSVTPKTSGCVLCDETRDRREVGVSDLHVRNDETQRSLTRPRPDAAMTGHHRNPEHGDVDKRKRGCPRTAIAVVAQHERDGGRPDEHGEVLQTEDVGEFEDPRHAVEQSEERRHADEKDKPRHHSTHQAHREDASGAPRARPRSAQARALRDSARGGRGRGCQESGESRASVQAATRAQPGEVGHHGGWRSRRAHRVGPAQGKEQTNAIPPFAQWSTTSSWVRSARL